MIDLKPYGAFLEYSIRPLLEELNKLGFQYNHDLFKKLIGMHVMSKIVDALTAIVCTVSVCITIYFIICKTSVS